MPLLAGAIEVNADELITYSEGAGASEDPRGSKRGSTYEKLGVGTYLIADPDN